MFITASCVLFLKKLKYFGHLKGSKGLGNIILKGEVRREKRKRKTEKVMGKEHSGCFRYFPDRS